MTGSAISYYEELDKALNPDWRSIPLATAPDAPALNAALATTARALPDFTPRFVDLPDRPGETITMLGSMATPDGEGRSAQAFVDPRDGSLLGWRHNGEPALDRRHLMDFLYGLHIDLMLGPTMTWFLGLVGLLWTLDHIAAAILSFPSAAKWKESFLVRGRGWNLRRIFDLHRAPGLWFLPVTAVVALSGAVLAWPETSRDAVRATGATVSERLHEHWPAVTPPADPIGAEAALAIAAARTGAKADSLLILTRQGVYGVRSFDGRDLDGYGRLWTYVSMADGRIVGQRHDNGEGAADAFFAWQYPLHSGKAFGDIGRALVFASGIVTTLLCVTGIVLWTRRGPLRRRRDR